MIVKRPQTTDHSFTERIIRSRECVLFQLLYPMIVMCRKEA